MKDYKITSMAAAFMAAAILNGCSGSQSGEPDAPVDSLSINIRAYSPQDDEPAVTPVEPNFSPLEETHTDFGVIAIKEVDGFPTQQVIRHDDATPYQTIWHEPAGEQGRWVYDITTFDGYTQYLRYWDLSAASYLFSAYSPYSITEAGTQVALNTRYDISLANDGAINISGITAHAAPADCIDWLVAKYERYRHSLLDYDLLAANPNTPVYHPATLTDYVPLRFHHILSQLNFRAYTARSTAFTITDIAIELMTYDADSQTFSPTYIITGADYADGTWTLDSSATASQLLDLHGFEVYVNGNSRETSSFIASLLEIPQDVADLWVKVYVKTESNQRTALFPLQEGWLTSYAYTYYLVLDEDEIILIDVDVDLYNWREGNDIDVKDPQINW